MGIYDRDYIRRQQAPGGPVAGGVAAMRMWSVNTWIIVACVLVFAIDGVIPRQPGWWKPVEVNRAVPHYVDLVGGHQYVAPPVGATDPRQFGILPGDAPAERHVLRSGSPLFARNVFDISATPPEKVGEIVYEWMPPLKRWLYFSTDTAVRRVEVWRLIGFQFLHVGLLHLLFNMVALYFFGPIVERHLGRKRYLAFYLLCGICGALLYLLLNLTGYVVTLYTNQPIAIPGLLFNSWATPLMGASAGVFGVLIAGAYLVPNATVLFFFVLPMRLATFAYALLALSVINLIMGNPNAGGEAGHLGGALAGFYLIRRPHRLHGFFDFLGWADPTSHHYRRRGDRGSRPATAGREQIDRILAKISSSGLHSLTEKEKRILREASERD